MLEIAPRTRMKKKLIALVNWSNCSNCSNVIVC